MKQKILYLSVSILFFNCLRAQNVDSIVQRCVISEETFDKSSMRKFLKTTNHRRNIIDKFLSDKSAYAFLSVQNDTVIYASFKKGTWEIIYNDEKYSIKDDSLASKIEIYSLKNTVYKTICPEDYIIYDGNIGLQAFWIKKSSEIKFLYYSTYCDGFCLNQVESKKIKILMEIDKRFKQK